MERTQKEKQQAFSQKLHTEGADSFADGPRPWEQWDESGSQHDNRIWEGTARRIHPKHKGASGFGDRLLSGLAVVALASMVVGIAGIYLSTPTTPQQARTLIQPPPIMASRTTTSPATRLVESADTAAPMLAKLDTLSPPAAGSPVSRVEHKTVLEPTMTAPRSAPVVPSDSIDKVAVETVITEEAVTTTVDTQQLSQDEPELVAMVATTAPPFTHDPTQNDKPSVAIARETARSDQTEGLATEPAIVAQTEVETTTAPANTEQAEYAASEPAIVEETAETVTAPTIVALAEIVESEPAVTEETAEAVATPTIITQAETVDTGLAVVEETAEAVATPTIVAQAGTVDTEPAVVEETAEAVATPTIVAQAGTVDTEPAVVEETAEAVATPTIVTQAETVDTEPTVVEETAEAVATPTIVAQAETVDTEPAVVEETAEAVATPTIVAQAGTVDTEPAVVEQAAEVVTEPIAVTQAETLDVEPVVVEETAKPATETAVATVNTTTTDAEAAPDMTRELETATQIPVPPAAKTGRWVINLSSYTRKPTAERMLAVFKQKGVDAEVFTTTINDKPMHRIRVTGFESARSAKAEISVLEQQLELEGAWISKR